MNFVKNAFGNAPGASRSPTSLRRQRPMVVRHQFGVHIIWMHEDAVLPGRPYLAKIGARSVGATIAQPKYRVDINNLEHRAASALELNEIGVCNVSLDRVLPFDPCDVNSDTGGFTVIDKLRYRPGGAGVSFIAVPCRPRLACDAVRAHEFIGRSSTSHPRAPRWLSTPAR